ncbi:hypothetical protein ACTFST_09810 [Bacillus cereus group sp. MYBK106-1]|uniref:hypothetical protein n=1 Tax=unclassified Bacillus cereus group TaxID=2750818 RepID=UPI003F7ADB07
MARKTKEMLEQELALLKSKNEELQEEIYELRYEKDYWFVKSERYLRLYMHEERKNWDCYNEHESAYEQMKERELKELKIMEENLEDAIYGVKAYKMEQRMLDYNYSA